MKTAFKGIIGWNQRSDVEKVAFRRLQYHLLRIFGFYLAFNVLAFFFPMPWLKRNLASLYVKKAVALTPSAPLAATQAAKRAITLFPDVSGGYDSLANIMLPGLSYYDLLLRFHEWLLPKSYLEIGVSTGASIVLAKPPTVAVGIDPNPQLLTAPATVCKIFPLTSDNYFAVRNPCADLEAETVDLAFIDGLHLFEQVLRDFINIERISSRQTVVLIHDSFPIDSLIAERERKTAFWTGDVWKIVPCLREFRPDLELFTIAAPPSGLSVVTRLDGRSTVLMDRFNEIVSRYASLQVDPDESQRRRRAVMVANNWEEIVARLPGCAA